MSSTIAASVRASALDGGDSLDDEIDAVTSHFLFEKIIEETLREGKEEKYRRYDEENSSFE